MRAEVNNTIIVSIIFNQREREKMIQRYHALIVETELIVKESHRFMKIFQLITAFSCAQILINIKFNE